MYGYKKEDWPWVWALREGMDWKEGLSEDDIAEAELQHHELPAPILPHLLIGNQLCVLHPKHLKEIGITHILNMSGPFVAKSPVAQYAELGIEYLKLDAEDWEGYPVLEKHLKEAQEFIDKAKRTSGKCVVHCEGGLNRSGLIVAAVYMLETRCNVLEAVQFLRRQRDEYALDNNSFQEQLVALARAEGLLGPEPGTPESLCKDSPPDESEREIPDYELEEQ